jgi:2,3-dihydroxybiphenyl 1,2-dioxygenase
LADDIKGVTEWKGSMGTSAVNELGIAGLGYLGIDSTDPDQWIPFGQDVLGMQATVADDTVRLKMDVRVYRVAIHRADRDGLGYVGWEMISPAALDSAAEHLSRSGIAVKRADRQWALERGVAGLVSFIDPSGVATELFVGARTEEAREFRSPTGARFVTGDQGAGHITVVCSQYDENFKFYSETLKFGISDFLVGEPLQVAFMGCNRRHHSIALIDGKDVAPSTLGHFMVEVDDLTTLGKAYDRCVDGAAPIEITMGKHWNDWMTSFYVKSPSGFTIEYGWNGRTVDRATWSAIQGNGEISIWGHRPTSPEAARTLGRKTWIKDFAAMKGQGAQ